MDVLILTVFVSLMLVAGGLVFFVSRLRGGDFEHGDRLLLLPLAEDTADEGTGKEGTGKEGRATGARETEETGAAPTETAAGIEDETDRTPIREA